ncbi:MAG: hypothetical protein V1781_06355 [Bacteroidota bacterium]
MIENKNTNQIELRSEEVKEIMGKVPHYIIRLGISLIFFIIVALFVISIFIKYPEKIISEITIENTLNNNFIAKVKVPVKNISKIKVNQKVILKLNQYSFIEYGAINNKISNVNYNSVIDNGKQYYIVEIMIGKEIITNSNKHLIYIDGLSGTAEIIINEKSLIYKLIQPIQVLFDN